MKLVLPGPTERAVFLGHTGAGKTFAIERFASYVENAHYLDLKEEFQPKVPYTRTDSFSKAVKREGHVLIRPKMAERTRLWYDWYFRTMLRKRKKVVIIADETYLLGEMHHAKYPAGLSLLSVIGRSKQLPLWAGIQRPRFAPTVLYAQAEHFYVWYLSPADVAALRDWIDPEALKAVANLSGDYGFVHVWQAKGGRQQWQLYSALPAD